MKKALLFSALGLAAASGAQAQEVGRVISSTPVIQQVAVPRQVCGPQAVAVPQHQGPGAGAAIGAIAGGLLGNTIGHGGGRAAATVLGVLGGAVVGDRVEGGGYPPQYVQHCSIQTSYENRAVAYNVTYEYAGRTYTAQMPQDPGPTVWLQVSPMAVQGPAAGPSQLPPGTSATPQADTSALPETASAAPPQVGIPILRAYQGAPQQAHGDTAYPPGAPHYPISAPAPIVYNTPWVQPAPIYYAPPVLPVFPAYGVRPYYPPVGISLHLGYSRGFGHGYRGHRGRWR